LRFVRIVAQGFARFWHIRGVQADDDYWSLAPTKDNLQKLSLVNSGFDFSRAFTVSHKEDGTFMLLYRFRDQIVCSSRHSFGEEMLTVPAECLGDRPSDAEPRKMSKAEFVLRYMRVYRSTSTSSTPPLSLTSTSAPSASSDAMASVGSGLGVTSVRPVPSRERDDLTWLTRGRHAVHRVLLRPNTRDTAVQNSARLSSGACSCQWRHRS
jgi:hypothetical protein